MKRRKMKLRSDVWEHFEKDGKDRAKCKHCGKEFNASSKTAGTTSLRTHFLSCSKKKDKPAEKMHIKKCSIVEPLPESIQATDIIDVYDQEKVKLHTYFKELPCRLSLMTVSDIYEKYIYFSVHFIDDDWKLKEKIISFRRSNDKEIIKNVLSEWGIDNKISYMVLDEYSYDNILSPYEIENGFISSPGSLHPSGKLLGIRNFHRMSFFCINEIKKVLRDRMSTIFYCIEKNKLPIALDKEVMTKVIGKGYIGVVELVGIALGQREVLFELEKMDTELKSINLTKEEWDLIATLGETKDQQIDRYDYKTANMYFPWLCRIYMISLEFVDNKISKSLPGYQSECIKDRMKCWSDDNLVLAVAAVLDPRFKMDIVKHWYEKIYGGECETRLATFKGYLTRVYNEYAKGTDDLQYDQMLDPSWKPCKCSHDHPTKSELDLYLEKVKFPSFRKFDILGWWRFYAEYFPTLAKMARDFLSIQITIPYGHLREYCHLYTNISEHRMDIDFYTDRVREAFICSKYWLNG